MGHELRTFLVPELQVTTVVVPLPTVSGNLRPHRRSRSGVPQTLDSPPLVLVGGPPGHDKVSTRVLVPWKPHP